MNLACEGAAEQDSLLVIRDTKTEYKKVWNGTAFPLCLIVRNTGMMVEMYVTRATIRKGKSTPGLWQPHSLTLVSLSPNSLVSLLYLCSDYAS